MDPRGGLPTNEERAAWEAARRHHDAQQALRRLTLPGFIRALAAHLFTPSPTEENTPQ